MEVTYEKGTEEDIAQAFGWVEGEDGLIVDAESGEPVEAWDGGVIRMDEMAAVGGEPSQPVREGSDFLDGDK